MGTPPKTPEEFRARAASCERLAKSALSPENRETMRYLAMRWRTFADQVEAKLKSPGRQPQPLPSSDGQGTYEDHE